MKKMNRKRKILSYITGAVIVFFPVIPLMIYKYFYIDYANNLWVIQYFSRYFGIHHSFPYIINSDNKLVGMTNPLYYGYLYYQIWGLIAFVVGGARRAVILCIIIMLTVIYIIYNQIFYRILKAVGKNADMYAKGIVALMMWSTYSISKMYDDGARGEYSGVLLLYIVIGCWILSLYQQRYVYRVALWMTMSLCMLLLGGTHPITTEIGGSVFLVIVFSSIQHVLKTTRYRKLTVLLGVLLAVPVILGICPWLYIVISGASDTKIGTNVLFPMVKSGPSNLLNRLIPFPFDIDSLYKGMNVTSPYLDLQINIPLAMVSLFTLISVIKMDIPRKSKYISFTIFAVEIFFFVFCSLDVLEPVTKKIFYSIQFIYRLITYVDLFALLGIIYNIYLITKGNNASWERWLQVILIISLTLSIHNVLIEWSQAYAISNYDVEDISSMHVPRDFYWGDDYSDISIPTIDNVNKDNVISVSVPVNKSSLMTEKLLLHVQDNVIINTNISASKYNGIYLNGKKITEENLYRLNDESYTYAFKLDKGGTYTLELVTELPPVYLKLRRVSGMALGVLIVCTVIMWLYILLLKYFGKYQNKRYSKDKMDDR